MSEGVSRLPTPGRPEAAAVRSMFDRIAPRYDLLNHLLSAGIDSRWRRAAVDWLGLGSQARLLDVCTGTADLIREALSRGAERRAVGVDLSGRMLRIGASKLAREGLAGRAPLLSADATRLPLRSAGFDGVVVGFGIRNVGEPARALAEMARVLRPGGRLVILEFSMPRGLLGRLYRLYFRSVLPRIGGLVSGDAGAYAYLPDSVERFATPEELHALLEDAGFVGVATRRLTGGVAFLYRGELPGPPERR
jgi:demethylmenaquinone methyltransferase/2-methoxy-6-polyprenyl-1,4-benzoquinol methylase